MRAAAPVISLALGFVAATLSGLATALETAFPGPWERYIQAPDESRIVRASRIYSSEGSVTRPSEVSNITVLRGQGALVTFEFPQNTGGRLVFCIDEPSTSFPQSVGVAFTESPEFAGRQTDSTNDGLDWDLSTFITLAPGVNGFDQDHIRGAFKYATFFVPAPGDPEEGQAIPREPLVLLNTRNDVHETSQRPLEIEDQPITKESIGIADVWVEFTAAPAMENPRAYTGFFNSSDELLNRIWYAGAYTLQLTSIPPKQGGALIDYNLEVNNNMSPSGSWYNNFTISNGTTVTVDGAKRDRMVYAEYMTIAAPGIAYSTYDLLSIKNALQTLFSNHCHSQSHPGRTRLPYAGPPMGSPHIQKFSDTYHLHALLGVYQYVLFSGDFDFLESIWDLCVQALRYSLDKVHPGTGLMFVTSSGNWQRPGMGAENIKAQGILYKALQSSVSLASWLHARNYSYTDFDKRDLVSLQTYWRRCMTNLRNGVLAPNFLFNSTVGLFSDNPRNRRHVFPQDGNAWSIFSGLLPAASPFVRAISTALEGRWGKHGAPALDAPAVISPFSTGFELHAHALGGHINRTLALTRRQWGYLLDGPGFTNSTFAEGFDVDGDHGYSLYKRRNRDSHAHGRSSAPTSVLMEYIVGIKLLEPLGRKWKIEPQLGDLGSVNGGFQTRLGKFVVQAVRREDGSEEMEIITPTGTQGFVVLRDAQLWIKDGGHWKWTRDASGKLAGGTVFDEKVVDQWEFRKSMEEREWRECRSMLISQKQL